MSHIAINGAGYSNTSYASSIGISVAAEFMKEQVHAIAKIQSRTGYSQVSIVKTLEVLERFKKDYSEPNWGGEDELPIDPLAIDNAKQFLRLLPARFHSPEVIPEADGSVGFEWHFGPFRSLIVSFSNLPRIEYSLLSGRLSSDFGHRPFYGLVPLDIVRYLNNIGNSRAIS